MVVLRNRKHTSPVKSKNGQLNKTEEISEEEMREKQHQEEDEEEQEVEEDGEDGIETEEIELEDEDEGDDEEGEEGEEQEEDGMEIKEDHEIKDKVKRLRNEPLDENQQEKTNQQKDNKRNSMVLRSQRKKTEKDLQLELDTQLNEERKQLKQKQRQSLESNYYDKSRSSSPSSSRSSHHPNKPGKGERVVRFILEEKSKEENENSIPEDETICPEKNYKHDLAFPNLNVQQEIPLYTNQYLPNAPSNIPSFLSKKIQVKNIPQTHCRIIEEFQDKNQNIVQNESQNYYRYTPLSLSQLDQVVEYDMDEQDMRWLEIYNRERKKVGLDPILEDTFELLVDQIEKERYSYSQVLNFFYFFWIFLSKEIKDKKKN